MTRADDSDQKTSAKPLGPQAFSVGLANGLEAAMGLLAEARIPVYVSAGR